MADNAFDINIAGLARSSEPDRYFAGLFVNARRRKLYWLIATFHGELNRILQVTREPTLAEIRLQWWRDRLAAFAQPASAGSDLADALLDRLRAGELALAPLMAMIETRSELLSGAINADLQDIEQFAEQLEGRTFALALAALTDTAEALPEPVQQAIDDAGRAYGLARLIMDVLRPNPRRSNWDVVLEPLAQSADLLGAVQAAAYQAGGRVQDRWQTLPVSCRTCLLPLAVIPAYLNTKQSVPRPSAQDLANVSDIRRLWLIWRAARRGHLV